MGLQGWLNDVRYALRGLRKSPGYTVVVVTTLALGIGATTAVFSVMNPYFFRPLPFADAPGLVQIGHVDRTSGFTWARFSLPQIEDYRSRARTVAGIGSYYYGSFNVTGAEGPERITGGVLSENMFDLLGTPPLLGRTFTPGESEPGGARVVVLDHGLWQRRYAGDRAVLGRTIELDGDAYEVVGVMPPDFVFPFGSVRLWIPDRRSPATAPRDVQGNLMIARLAPGFDPNDLAAELSEIHREFAGRYPDVDGAWVGIHVAGLREALNFAWDILRMGLFTFLAAVGSVLLIACVNVTSLTLARGQSRGRELAIRTALGAGRARLVRQLLMESLVLAGLGGALGLLLAWGAAGAASGILPEDLYRVGDAEIDVRVALFTLGVTVLTPLVFGLWPARATTREDLTTPLREGGAGAGHARHVLRLRRGLVVAEVALGVVLVAAAGLLVRSALELAASDLGLEAGEILTAEAIPSADAYPSRTDHTAYWNEVVERVRAAPGVRHAATVYPLPLNHETTPVGYASPESTPPAGAWPQAQALWSSPGYVDAAGLRLLAGRDFLPEEGAEEGEPLSAIVSTSVASALWPDRPAIGRALLVDIGGAGAEEVRVVGVVADHHHDGIDENKDPLVYLPMERRAFRRRFLVVRGEQAPGTLVPAVRQVMAEVDPDLPVDFRPMSAVVQENAYPWTIGSVVLAVFGGVGLLLAALGVYGVVNYTVSERRREMAIRMSLGADASRVRRSVVLDALGMTGVGIGLGLIGALTTGALIRSFLFGITPTDPIVLVGSLMLFTAVAALAAYLPARRASSVSPSMTLRSD